MLPNEYQQLALSKEADQELIGDRIYRIGVQATRMDNGLRGLVDECGELAGAIKKWLEYGGKLDRTNIVEECGDALWRLSQILKGVDATLEEAMAANLAKLNVRYGDGICNDIDAAEENRDRDAERDAMVSPFDGSVTPEPVNDLCPKCGAPAHFYNSSQYDSAYRDYCQCKNPNCSHSWFVTTGSVGSIDQAAEESQLDYRPEDARLAGPRIADSESTESCGPDCCCLPSDFAVSVNLEDPIKKYLETPPAETLEITVGDAVYANYVRDDIAKRGFDIARKLAQAYCVGKDKTRALKLIADAEPKPDGEPTVVQAAASDEPSYEQTGAGWAEPPEAE